MPSWLELFFDLIFVAAVAQVAEPVTFRPASLVERNRSGATSGCISRGLARVHDVVAVNRGEIQQALRMCREVRSPLRDQYSLLGLVRFTPLFVLIWLAWTGHTLFSTRFDTDDVIQRGLTLVQMFAVAVMAANAKDALDGRSSAGFAAAYAAVRFILVAQYFRARHVPEGRPLTTRYLVGHGSAAVLWLASALIPSPARFWNWGIAFSIDLGTPWLAVPHSVKVPPDAALNRTGIIGGPFM